MLKNNIGIDRTIIKNIKVEKIDFNKIRNRDNIELSPSNATSLKEVDRIRIIDNYKFKDFTYIKSFKNNIGEIISTYLGVSISELEGNNLNYLEKNKYDELLQKIVDYIEYEYGVKVDISLCKWDEVEIGVNLKLTDEYLKYEQVLKFIINSMSKCYNKMECKNCSGSPTTFYGKSKSMKFTLYNKAEELKRKLKIPYDILRIEMSIIDSKRLKELLNNEFVLQTKQEDIEKLFIYKMEKEIIYKARKRLEQQKKYILNLVKESQKHNSGNNQKISKLYTDLIAEDRIIDVIFLEESIRITDRHNNAARTIRNLKQGLNSLSKFEGNIEKIDEIFCGIKKVSSDVI